MRSPYEDSIHNLMKDWALQLRLNPPNCRCIMHPVGPPPTKEDKLAILDALIKGRWEWLSTKAGRADAEWGYLNIDLYLDQRLTLMKGE